MPTHQPRAPARRTNGGEDRPSARARASVSPPKSEEAGEGGEVRHIPGIALSLLKDFYWIELGIRSYLRARGNPEFSRSEGMVIANISLGYSRPSDIARQLGISRQAIHVTIQQMKRKGIVDLVKDPDDRRIKLVVITDLARQMNDDGMVAMSILWEELGRRLGPAQLAKAANVLAADWGEPVTFEAPG